jgi:hypothetical protein
VLLDLLHYRAAKCCPRTMNIPFFSLKSFRQQLTKEGRYQMLPEEESSDEAESGKEVRRRWYSSNSSFIQSLLYISCMTALLAAVYLAVHLSLRYECRDPMWFQSTTNSFLPACEPSLSSENISDLCTDAHIDLRQSPHMPVKFDEHESFSGYTAHSDAAWGSVMPCKILLPHRIRG